VLQWGLPCGGRATAVGFSSPGAAPPGEAALARGGFDDAADAIAARSYPE
jgi:hypothetical protein